LAEEREGVHSRSCAFAPWTSQSNGSINGSARPNCNFLSGKSTELPRTIDDGCSVQRHEPRRWTHFDARANGEATRPKRSSPAAQARTRGDLVLGPATKSHHMKRRSSKERPDEHRPIGAFESKRHSSRPAPRYASAPVCTTVPSTNTEPLATMSAYSQFGSSATVTDPVKNWSSTPTRALSRRAGELVSAKNRRGPSPRGSTSRSLAWCQSVRIRPPPSRVVEGCATHNCIPCISPDRSPGFSSEWATP